MRIDDFRILGIIPARGGSKGVKRKNVRLLAGKPLISYTIEAAKSSELLTDFVVSTDDDEIASVADKYGSEVYLRPSGLAQDTTPMLPVLKHTLLEAEEKNKINYHYVMILQPTAPLRKASDIDNAIVQLYESGADSLVSLYKVEDTHPSRMYTISNGKLNKVMEEPEGALRQTLEPVFHRNGSIYLSSRDLLLNEQKILSDQSVPYIMSGEISLNIDTEQDLEYAEFVFSKITKK